MIDALKFALCHGGSTKKQTVNNNTAVRSSSKSKLLANSDQIMKENSSDNDEFETKIKKSKKLNEINVLNYHKRVAKRQQNEDSASPFITKKNGSEWIGLEKKRNNQYTKIYYNQQQN